jgi:hypothetical protein
MGTILKKPRLHAYNVSDHLEFHKLAYKICEKNASLLGDASMVPNYWSAIIQEETTYKWFRKSIFTAKKAETDRARDRAIKGIAAIIRNDLKHFDPAMRDHAMHINILFQAYGNMPAADYDAETANIDSLLERLGSADYQTAIQAMRLGEWINELHKQNELFKTYVDDASKEQLTKPGIEPKKARRQTDEALQVITNRIIALVMLNGTLGYEGFITEFNMLVNHYNTLLNEHYGRLHARINITQADIGMIPLQLFTGKPVFVIPELTVTTVKEGKEITLTPIFSKDFTVTYQNNVNPGTATLIIKGIDKYIGEIVTTFNILPPAPTDNNTAQQLNNSINKQLNNEKQ